MYINFIFAVAETATPYLLHFPLSGSSKDSKTLDRINTS